VFVTPVCELVFACVLAVILCPVPYCVCKGQREQQLMSGFTYAIMLTCFPFAFSAMLAASFAARASTLPLGGTAATMTSMPFSASASVIPRQYCIPGRYCPARRNSLKPNKPCARMIVFLGVSLNRQQNSSLQCIWNIPYFSRITAYSSLISRPKFAMRGSSLRNAVLLKCRRIAG
jgi:hypothetical protein